MSSSFQSLDRPQMGHSPYRVERVRSFLPPVWFSLAAVCAMMIGTAAGFLS